MSQNVPINNVFIFTVDVDGISHPSGQKLYIVISEYFLLTQKTAVSLTVTKL